MPFRLVGQEVEVRGQAGRVQVLKDAAVVAEHPRGTDALLLRDEACWMSPRTDPAAVGIVTEN